MKDFIIILATCLIASQVIGQVEYNIVNGVYELTDETFNNFAFNTNNTMVEFYANYCYPCLKFAVEYEKAAELGKKNDPPIRFGRIDCQKYEEFIVNLYSAKSFPHFVYFKEGIGIPFIGDRSAESLVEFSKSKMGPLYHKLSCDELEQKNEIDYRNVVIFSDEQDKQAQSLTNELIKNSQIQSLYNIYAVNDQQCLTKYVKDRFNAVLVFRQYDDSPVYYPQNSLDNSTDVTKWLFQQGVPSLIKMQQQYIGLVHNQKAMVFALFVDPKLHLNEPWFKEFQKAAFQFKGNGLFVYSGVSKEESEKMLAERAQVYQNTTLPKFVILDTQYKAFVHYDQTFTATEITVEKIATMLDELSSKTIVPYIKSQPIIEEDNNKPVKKIVAKQYRDIVNDPTKDVFVKFYAPWCNQSKKFAPIWEQFAEELKDVPDLIIAEIDYTQNTLLYYKVNAFPNVIFYGKKSKREPQIYKGIYEVEDLKEFLKKKSHSYKKYLKLKEKSAQQEIGGEKVEL